MLVPEFKFIYYYLERFFSTRLPDQISIGFRTSTNDWALSHWIQKSVEKFTTSRMIKQLLDHTTAPPDSGLQHIAQGVKVGLLRTASFSAGRRSGPDSQHIPCSVYSLDWIYYLLTGETALQRVNDAFPLLNSVSFSFPVIYSVKPYFEKLDWKSMPFPNSKQGNFQWKNDIFTNLEIGYYCMQMDIKGGIGREAQHVLSLQILSKWETCTHPDDTFATMRDNRAFDGFAQRKDVVIADGLQFGDRILKNFLGFSPRLTSIIRVWLRTRKTSAYDNALREERKRLGKRSTRQTVLEHPTVSDRKLSKLQYPIPERKASAIPNSQPIIPSRSAKPKKNTIGKTIAKYKREK